MITNPQKIKIANLLYGKTQTTTADIAPNNFYLGLSTASDLSSGDVAGEIDNKQGYARLVVSNNSESFEPVSGQPGVVRNKKTFMWPEAEEAWGQVNCVFFADAATGGNVLYYIPVDRNIPINATMYFNSGDLTLKILNEDE